MESKQILEARAPCAFTMMRKKMMATKTGFFDNNSW